MSQGDITNWQHTPEARLKDAVPGAILEFLKSANPTPKEVAAILVNLIRRVCEQETRIQRLEAEARKRGAK